LQQLAGEADVLAGVPRPRHHQYGRAGYALLKYLLLVMRGFAPGHAFSSAAPAATAPTTHPAPAAQQFPPRPTANPIRQMRWLLTGVLVSAGLGLMGCACVQADGRVLRALPVGAWLSGRLPLDKHVE
jgi:hypothetical protein